MVDRRSRRRALLALLSTALAPVARGDGLVARESLAGGTPRRIVSLDDLSTELLVTLGIRPVGVANLDGYRRHVAIGADLLAHAVELGSPNQPDLEAIARLRPDLTIGVSYLHLGLFARLRAIAPTLIFAVDLDPAGPDAVALGEALLVRLGRLTGRVAQAEAALADARDAVAAAAAAVHAKGLAGRPMAALYPYTRDASFIVSNQQTLIASLVRRLGVIDPWPLASPTSLHRRLPLREVAAQPELTVLFIGGQERAPFFATPLWLALPVARARRFAFLPSPYWSFGGPRSAQRIAGQMREAIETMPAAPGGEGAD